MTDTKQHHNVGLPTGLTILAVDGMVTMKANDLVRALQQAALDGAAMQFYIGQTRYVATMSRTLSAAVIAPVNPRLARWQNVPDNYAHYRKLQEWVRERFPTVKVERTVWTNRKLDLVVPTYGRLWFQVEAGQLLMRPDGHPDVPDNWKPCTVPVVAFTANQLNLLRKLYKSPSISTTTTEE